MPEIEAAQLAIAREEKGGRSLVGLSAAQYHRGGLIGDFGDLALNATEGLILAQRGETMMTARATSSFGPWLDAMNRNAISPAQLRGSQMVAAGGVAGGPEVHLHIQTMDAKSFLDWGRRGGASQLKQLLNMGIAQYGGLGIRG